MALIDLGEFKIRFDPKEVRISIDGEIIDVGARREEQLEEKYYPDGKGGYDLGIRKKEEDTDIAEKWADDIIDIHDKLTGRKSNQ